MEKLLPKEHKSRVVYQSLLDELREGVWPSGCRFPSERDLTERFGCSRVTVRSALEKLAGMHLVERRHGSGTYVPERNVLRRCDSIALVLKSDLPNYAEDPYYSQLLGGFFQASSQAGFAPMILRIEPHENCMDGFRRLNLVPTQYDGLLFQYDLGDAEIAYLEEHCCRFVGLGPPRGERLASYVNIDNYQGAFLATRHLLEMGYRSPVLLNGPLNVKFNTSKLAGFVKALQEFHIRYDADRMLHEVVPFREAEAMMVVRQLLERKQEFDSLLIYGDWATWGAVRELRARSIRVPEDVAVIMYDDFPWVSRVLDLPLTVVRQPFAEQVEAAVKLLQRMMEKENHSNMIQIIQPALIVRQSSGILLRRQNVRSI